MGNNNEGVTGVCWKVKIMAVKFLNDLGWGATSDAIASIDYAVMMGADILSNSWGCGVRSGSSYSSDGDGGCGGKLAYTV